MLTFRLDFVDVAQTFHLSLVVAAPHFSLLLHPSYRWLVTSGSSADHQFSHGVVMRSPITQIPSILSGPRRILELWPYLFVAVSVVGLTYIALSAAR